MTWIQKAVLASVAFYILLMVAEIMTHPQILPGAVAGSVLLGVVAGAFLYRDDHNLHSGEMILVWAMILLFVCYGVLCMTGVIS